MIVRPLYPQLLPKSLPSVGTVKECHKGTHALQQKMVIDAQSSKWFGRRRRCGFRLGSVSKEPAAATPLTVP
jgi:hypothetical protein